MSKSTLETVCFIETVFLVGILITILSYMSIGQKLLLAGFGIFGILIYFLLDWQVNRHHSGTIKFGK
ncbi:MAG: hypothetical protein WC650_04205 [Candidatus Doudnabacteria bacterium]